MREIRIIVDLPSENMLNMLRLRPMDDKYDSMQLKTAIEKRLSEEFPNARMIKVNIIQSNAFFGVDVMGIRFEEVLDTMNKVYHIISSILKEEFTSTVSTVR